MRHATQLQLMSCFGNVERPQDLLEGMELKKGNLVEALRTLEASDENRSETSRLIDVFDNVESALRCGVRRTAVLAALHSQGFTMTAKSFESAIYRIRKKRKLNVANGDIHESSQVPERSTEVGAQLRPAAGFFPSPSADEIYAKKAMRESMSNDRKKTTVLPRR